MVKPIEIAQVTYAVPDLAVMEKFMTDFGLTCVNKTDEVLYMRGSGEQHHIHVSYRAEKQHFIGASIEVSCLQDLNELAKLEGSSAVQASSEQGGGYEVVMIMPDGKYAKKILNEIASARDDLVAISEGRATRIAIGLLPAVSLSILPNFIARVENEMVSTSINAREGSSDVLISLLRTGELDVMIGNLAAKPLGIEFRTKHLYKDPIVVVVKKGHPLVTKQDLVWTDLSEFPMVLPPEFATTRIVIEEFLLCHQVNLSKRYVESLSTLTNIGVLLATESIGFLSFQLADYFKKANLVDILPLTMKNIYIDIGLVWYTERTLTPSQLNIISMLEDTVFISNLK